MMGLIKLQCPLCFFSISHTTEHKSCVVCSMAGFIPGRKKLCLVSEGQ